MNVNQLDKASRLIYFVTNDEEMNVKRDPVDEFIDQNYGSIYMGKKGILAYEEKKTQVECQKIFNPYHLRKVLDSKMTNPVKAQVLKISLKSRITARGTGARREKLKLFLSDMRNY